MKKQRITSHGSLPERGRQSCAIGVTILCPPTVLPQCRTNGEGLLSWAMKEPVRGHLAPHAASVLMKLLYGARIARFDLLRQVNRLARNVHRWTDSDDRGLHHLMCYVHHTKHWRMVGWVGDPIDDVHLALYADADFAGCIDSLRSTSGGHLNIQGPNTRFPLSGSSKRQGCVSHSTPEAEIVAADVAMRSMGMPALKLVERILKKSPNFVFYDDNKAMIGVVRSGRNPTMRHLERSHGVSISWMHEMFTRDYMYLAYEVTDRMAADIYTKAFNDGRKWKHACLQIGLLDPSLLSDPDTLKALTPTCDPIKGTMQTASGTVDGVPTFPYTHIPIMPPDLWWSGLTSKEGLHEHEGHDPVVVAKGPRLMRVKPPLAAMTPFGSKVASFHLVSEEWSWLKVEDRLIQGYNVCELMVGLNAQFGSFIPYRSLHRRGNGLHGHDQFTSGPGMLTCSPCWPHLLKNCRTSA